MDEVKNKYDNFEDPSGTVAKFHYGTHYSNSVRTKIKIIHKKIDYIKESVVDTDILMPDRVPESRNQLNKYS